MKQDLAIRALNMAIALRRPPPDCIHHSDRGSQHCAHDYQKILHNGAGFPMRSDISPGQTSDHLGFDPVLDDNLPEPCVLPEPGVLLADRGHTSDKVRKTMEARHVVPVIPMRKSRKLRVAVVRKLYRLRNLVERCFNKLKNARRVATRYDKTAESFPGFIDITSIRLWIRHLST